MTDQLLRDFYLASPITVSLTDIEAGTVPSSTLLAAFGPDSLGILVVTGLPPSFPSLRSRVLSSASLITHLPGSELERLQSPDTNYMVGWSCGRERLTVDGPRDRLKGSYYWSCLHPDSDYDLHYTDMTTSASGEGGPSILKPGWIPNLVPAPPFLPAFAPTLAELCDLIIRIGTSVARVCDTFALENVAGYVPGTLERIVKESCTHRARLLHYFPLISDIPSTDNDPQQQKQQQKQHVWCTPHLDHGCLTGLTAAQYVDESELLLPSGHIYIPVLHGDQEPTLRPVPTSSITPTSGLFIIDRSGRAAKVVIPPDALAFQTGESLERMTKGQLKAVKHFVVGSSGNSGSASTVATARNTLAVFMQPNYDELVVHSDDPSGDGSNKTFKQFSDQIWANNYR